MVVLTAAEEVVVLEMALKVEEVLQPGVEAAEAQEPRMEEEEVVLVPQMEGEEAAELVLKSAGTEVAEEPERQVEEVC